MLTKIGLALVRKGPGIVAAQLQWADDDRRLLDACWKVPALTLGIACARPSRP